MNLRARLSTVQASISEHKEKENEWYKGLEEATARRDLRSIENYTKKLGAVELLIQDLKIEVESLIEDIEAESRQEIT